MRTLIAALSASVTLGLGTANADVIYDWVPTSPATAAGFGEVPFYATITLTDEAVAAGGSSFRLAASRSNLPQPPFDPMATDPLTLSYVTSGRIADFAFQFAGDALGEGGRSVTGDTVLGWVEPYFRTDGVNPGFASGILDFDLSVRGDGLFGRFDVVDLFTDFTGISDEALWSFDFNADGGPAGCFSTGRCQDATGRFVRRAATEVPEPATFALLLPALGLLGFAARRLR